MKEEKLEVDKSTDLARDRTSKFIVEEIHSLKFGQRSQELGDCAIKVV
jgi:hypothetical protein